MNTMPQEESLVKAMLQLIEASRDGFGQDRVCLRAMGMTIGEVMSFNGHHVTDLLRSVGLVEEDWTAWYRLLQKPSRMNEEKLGQALVAQTWTHIGANEAYVVGIDTTSVPRTSPRIEGTGWAKCPRNPPWRVGIHRAQRFLNLSWLAPLEDGYSRAIPLRVFPSFTEKAMRQVHEAQVEPQTGASALTWVRSAVDQHNEQTPVLCLADGSYDRPDFWNRLSENTFALVRTAKNRKLMGLAPEPTHKPGRKRKYGERAPAPHDYLSQREGWQSITVRVRGQERRMVTRVEGPFLREKIADRPLMLICVRGQSWKRKNRSRRREPVYYLVNAVKRDGEWQLPFSLHTLLAWVWQRWELEVVHREVKSGFGLGDKQCFNTHAAVASVQWSAWVYSLLMLTAYRRWGTATHLKRSTAWQRHPRRWTLQTTLDAFRHELTTHSDFSWLRCASPAMWQKFEAELLKLTSPSLSHALL